MTDRTGKLLTVQGTALSTDTADRRLNELSASEIRALIRSGEYDRHTAGLAVGKLQANLAIVPSDSATDFIQFCQRNPKPCPVVGIGEPGRPGLPELGEDIDIRTDVPRYRVFRDGVVTEEVTDIASYWRDDLVTIALGCSFTFENALSSSGIPIKHIDLDQTVPMYRSNILLEPAGPFAGEMVITMRPIPDHRIDDAYEISGRYPQAHGAPLGHGNPEEFGITDLQRPDWGDPVGVSKGETPVYWACGVTPQNVLMNAKLPFCITHAPGHMLIADVNEDADVRIFQ